MIRKKRKGVSSIVGVILMVTLAVILAALLSQFATELAGILPQPIQAGITFSEEYNPTTGEYTVTVVWSQEGTVEELHAIKPDGSTTPVMTKIGEDVNIVAREGETIRIIGTLGDGTKGVIQEYTVGE
jgi:flagellin-like protein